MCLPSTNRSLGECDWSKDVANILVEPNSLVERRRLPSVNEVHEEEEEWATVRKFQKKTSWMRVETNCGVGKDI